MGISGEVMRMGEFPEGYPDDLLDRIRYEGGEFASPHVYRVAPYGYNHPDSYLSTILNDKLRKVNKNRNPYDLSTYSTSCCMTKEAAENLKGIHFRKVPGCEIAEGDILPSFGPCRINKKTEHVDWWLFKDATPWEYFVRSEV